MTVYTAKRKGRINVWPSHAIAHAADLASDTASKHSHSCLRLTVWPTYQQAAANMTYDTGGGGGGPEWVPENAKIFIDFVNDRAWTEADGEVAIDTLLGSDQNTENYWGESSYDPETMLSVEGLIPNENSDLTGIIGTARSVLVGGATVRFFLKQLDVADGIKYPFMMMAADGANGMFQTINIATAKANLGGEGAGMEGLPISIGVGEISGIAFTATPDRAELAVNGSAAMSATIDSAWWPDANPFVAAGIYLGSNFAMRALTIYDPLPDTDGLSELSEVA